MHIYAYLKVQSRNRSEQTQANLFDKGVMDMLTIDRTDDVTVAANVRLNEQTDKDENNDLL